MEPKLVTIEQIAHAHDRLPPQVVRTPLLPCPALSEEAPVLLKAESLQVTGSYKARAAFTVLNSLDAAARRRGAALASSGNFATAFAFMGRLLGIPTAVVMMQRRLPSRWSGHAASGLRSSTARTGGRRGRSS
jgi:threonine dehydratase